MARFKKIPQVSREGKIIYCNGIVDGIVYFAVSELDYVELTDMNSCENETNKAIKVNLNKNMVDVWVDVKIHFSQSVSETSFKIQETVRHNIEAMTGYKVESVNVKVSGITFGEYVKANNTEQQPPQENVENLEEKEKNN